MLKLWEKNMENDFEDLTLGNSLRNRMYIPEYRDLFEIIRGNQKPKEKQF